MRRKKPLAAAEIFPVCENAETALARPLSRRAFFLTAGVTGALAFLGSCAGGRIIAFADELGQPSFVVTVLSRRDVVVLALDVVNGNRVVPGMSVVLRSLGNGNVVEGTTGEQGVAVLRIQDLADDPSDDADTYAFWGRVSAYKEGYREFENRRVRVEGGPLSPGADGKRAANIQIPTRPADSQPYVRVAAFDEDDVQYGRATFPVCAANTSTHTVTMQVMAPKGTAITASLSANGAVILGPVALTAEDAGADPGSSAAERATAAKGAGATFRFEGAFLRDLAPGTVLEGRFSTGGASYTVPLSVTLCEPAGGIPSAYLSDSESVNVLASDGAADAPEPVAASDWKFSPVPPLVVLPSSWPVIGGATLALDLPFFPVNVVVDPQGGYGVALNMAPIFPTRNGHDFNPDDWRFMSRETMEKYRARTQELFMNALKRYDQAQCARADTTGKVHYPSFCGVESRVDFGLQMVGTFDEQVDLYLGSAALSLAFAFFLVKGKQFVLGPVPVFISVDFFSRTAATGTLSCSMQPWSSFSEPSLSKMIGSIRLAAPDERKSGLTLVQRFEMGASLGAGIHGLASVALRGYGFVGLTLDVAEPPVEGYPVPHVNVSAGVGLQCVVQVLLFKGSFNIANKAWPRAFDNWPDQTSEGDQQGDGGDGDMNELLSRAFGLDIVDVDVPGEELVLGRSTDEVVMVGNGELAALAEFEASVGQDGALTDVGYLGKSATGAEVLAEAPGIDEVYVRRDGADRAGAVDPHDAYELRYNLAYGVRPSIEKVIFSDVVSDPRAKLVVANGTRYLCRISSVLVSAEGGGSNGGCAVMHDADGEPFFVRDAWASSGTNGEESRLTWDDSLQAYVAPASGDGTAAALAAGFEEDGEAAGPSSRGVSGEAASYDGVLFPDDSPEQAKAARTRVTVSCFDEERGSWGDPAVVDFSIPEVADPQYARENAFDVDFQVVASAGYPFVQTETLNFAITSCIRPVGEGKTLDNQAKLQYVTYVSVDPRSVTPSGGVARCECAITLVRMLTDTKRSCWSAQLGEVEEDGNRYMLVQMLSMTRFGTVEYVTKWIERSTMRSGSAQRLPLSIVDFDCGYGATLGLSTSADGRALACITDDGQTGSIVMEAQRQLDVGDVRTVRIAQQGVPLAEPEYGFVYTQTTGQTDEAGTPEKRVLMAGRDSSGALVADIEIGRCTVSSIIPSPRRGYLFAVRNVDSRTAPREEGDVPVRRYQVLAANLRRAELASYGGFYPFAQFDMPIDDIVCLDASAGAASFCYTTVKDIDRSIGDVRHVIVPFVQGVELQAAACCDSFYGPGDPCAVMLEVRNTGNVALRGYTALVHDAPDGAGRLVASIDVQLGENVVSTGMADYVEKLDAQGKPTGEFGQPDGADLSVLYPGDVRTNKVRFTMPADVSGEMTLYVSVGDVAAADAGGADGLALFGDRADAPDGGIVSLIDPVSEPVSLTASCEVSGSSEFGRGDYRVERTGPGGGAAGGESDRGGGTPHPLADTGDAVDVPGLLGAAGLGAVAAGVSWYERRRAENERHG